MLSLGHAANETFSPGPEEVEGHSREVPPPRFTGAGGPNQVGPFEPGSEENAMDSGVIRRGDRVVFERLDVADALGIWRNARGRIVDIHGQEGRSATVDVAFEGHAVLRRYLPNLFRRVH